MLFQAFREWLFPSPVVAPQQRDNQTQNVSNDYGQTIKLNQSLDATSEIERFSSTPINIPRNGSAAELFISVSPENEEGWGMFEPVEGNKLLFLPKDKRNFGCPTKADNLNSSQLECFNRLLNGKWLNAECVNSFLHWLSLKFEDTGYIDSSYFQTLTFLSTGEIDRSFFQSENPYTRNLYNNRIKYGEKNILFCPIAKDNHWFLLLIERKKDNFFTIGCLDGFNRGAEHTALLNLGLQLITDIWALPQFEWQAGTYKVPRQNNTIDCGTVVCYFAQQTAIGVELANYRTKEGEWDYTQVRRYIASALGLLTYPTLRESNTFSPHYDYSRERERDRDRQVSNPSINRTSLAIPLRG